MSVCLDIFSSLAVEFLEESGVGLLGQQVVSALGREGVKDGSDFLEGNASSEGIPLVPPVGVDDGVCGVEQLPRSRLIKTGVGLVEDLCEEDFEFCLHLGFGNSLPGVLV